MKHKELYDAIVFIGRFQPPHRAHQEMFIRALSMGKKLIILAGSASQPRTIKNPWTWRERAEMIYSVIPVEHHSRVKVRPLPDKKPMDNQWAKQVQDVVASLTDSTKIAILGNKKDETSYYLDMFPQWPLIEQHDIDTMHATDVRDAYFGNFEAFEAMEDDLPEGIFEHMHAFALTEKYQDLVKEWKFYDNYHKQWDWKRVLVDLKTQLRTESKTWITPVTKFAMDAILAILEKVNIAPYLINFVTTDAIVIQSGHILLVKRRAYPGKGLWALPGGFLNTNETILAGTLRELKEETKIDCPLAVLRGSIGKRDGKKSDALHVFDEPAPSLRGRTITHATLFELTPGPLPKVKGSDDAEVAKWIPLTVFDKMEDQMFEDHYHIAQYMIAKT